MQPGRGKAVNGALISARSYEFGEKLELGSPGKEQDEGQQHTKENPIRY